MGALKKMKGGKAAGMDDIVEVRIREEMWKVTGGKGDRREEGRMK